MKGNKNTHLTISDRIQIEKAITNGAKKSSIADTLGKDKSTIGKEIKLHRKLIKRNSYPIDCVNYPKCKNKNSPQCSKKCSEFKEFKCTRRDRSPGACNGCSKYGSCRHDKYRYIATDADHEYRSTLVSTRSGVNATVEEIKQLGLLIKPLIDQKQSLFVILHNHPEIKVTERTLYNYIEDGVFQDVGVSIKSVDSIRQVRRKIPKNKQIRYSPRKDRKYLQGRTEKDYQEYMLENPNVNVVQMDTVYNDVSNGPFLQTFKFMKYDLFFCIYHEVKDSQHMLEGIKFLESILGEEIFSQEAAVIKTDRGSEFVLADEIEMRENGSRRCRIFYCDPMSSCQKASLENNHIMVREICPNEVDLYLLGLVSQREANIISSHINSYPKEKLNGKTSFQLLEFFNKDMADKLYAYGLQVIEPDEVTLTPSILKNK